MDPIIISEEFKQTIAHFIKNSETNHVGHIIADMGEQGFIDGEFGNLIFGEDPHNPDYNVNMDLEVIDAVEDEIKKQLLVKYNKIN
jgi:hypothetical protein